MLVIRQAQLDAMGLPRLRDFERRLVAHMADVLRAAGIAMEEHTLVAQLGQGIASGQRFFQTERTVARYCELVLVNFGGWGRTDHAQAGLQMLTSSAIDADVRLNNFERWARMQKAGHAR